MRDEPDLQEPMSDGDPIGGARGMCLGVAVMLILVAATVVLYMIGCPKRAHAASIHNPLALAKCRIIANLYARGDSRDFYPWCGTLIAEHERLALTSPEGRGFESAWWWSMVYGGANFNLRCYTTAPGNCAGPMDVKHLPLLTDPGDNIRYHCLEMFGFWKRGVRGIDLCKHMFYPAAPRDWGGHMFAVTDERHRIAIFRGYARGRLL